MTNKKQHNPNHISRNRNPMQEHFDAIYQSYNSIKFQHLDE